MRWWLRGLLTLALGPVAWWIGTGYVATQQGATLAQWGGDIPKVLPGVYLVYTLPAVLLCAVLLGVDRLLKLLSLDLFTVLLSPVLAYLLAWLAVRFVPEPHVQAAGAALPLFAAYGLVWGLTVREPRPRDRSVAARATNPAL